MIFCEIKILLKINNNISFIVNIIPYGCPYHIISLRFFLFLSRQLIVYPYSSELYDVFLLVYEHVLENIIN